MTMPTAQDDRRFAFEEAHKLDSEERLQRQPPDALIRLLSAVRPSIIVDIGAGTGTIAIPLALAMPDSHVLCVDVEPRMLEMLKQRAVTAGVRARITTREMPADRLELEAESADAILLVNVLHELPDRASYIGSLHRVLRRGGLVLICDWDPDAMSDAGPPRPIRVGRNELLSALRRAGFVDEKEHPLYADFYTITARTRG